MDPQTCVGHSCSQQDTVSTSSFMVDEVAGVALPHCSHEASVPTPTQYVREAQPTSFVHPVLRVGSQESPNKWHRQASTLHLNNWRHTCYLKPNRPSAHYRAVFAFRGSRKGQLTPIITLLHPRGLAAAMRISCQIFQELSLHKP